MQLPVDIHWPGNHRSGLLTTEDPSSFHGIPVVVFDGIAHSVSDLPSGCRVVVEWCRVRTGPVWEIVERLLTAGTFPVEIQFFTLT